MYGRDADSWTIAPSHPHTRFASPFPLAYPSHVSKCRRMAKWVYQINTALNWPSPASMFPGRCCPLWCCKRASTWTSGPPPDKKTQCFMSRLSHAYSAFFSTLAPFSPFPMALHTSSIHAFRHASPKADTSTSSTPRTSPRP